MNYKTRERAMKFAIELASNDFLGGWSVENIITTAEKFESYLGGTWEEPGGCLEGKKQETRLDRLKAMRSESNGVITLEFPDYLVYTMGFGERFENSDTTEETAED